MSRRVLLFDDNGVALAIVSECLRLLMPDITVETASHMAEVLSKASAGNFDVIVCNASLCRLEETGFMPAFSQLCPDAVVITLAPMHLQADDIPVHSDIDEIIRLVRVALGPIDKDDQRQAFRRAS